jgi:hypothetical protein
MSAAEDEGAGTSGKRTHAALTAGLCQTAAVLCTRVGPRLIARTEPGALTSGPAAYIVAYSLRICLMRAIASSTACSGLMPSTAMRWTAFAHVRSCQIESWRMSPVTTM